MMGTPTGQIAMKMYAAATARECSSLVWHTTERSLRRNPTVVGPAAALAATLSTLRKDSHDHAAKTLALTVGTKVKLSSRARGKTATPALERIVWGPTAQLRPQCSHISWAKASRRRRATTTET